jgi:hypothetical protein
MAGTSTTRPMASPRNREWRGWWPTRRVCRAAERRRCRMPGDPQRGRRGRGDRLQRPRSCSSRIARERIPHSHSGRSSTSRRCRRSSSRPSRSVHTASSRGRRQRCASSAVPGTPSRSQKVFWRPSPTPHSLPTGVTTGSSTQVLPPGPLHPEAASPEATPAEPLSPDGPPLPESPRPTLRARSPMHVRQSRHGANQAVLSSPLLGRSFTAMGLSFSPAGPRFQD